MNEGTAKDQLEGVALPDGWTVIKKLEKSQNDTGGNFSTGYIVRSPEGREHFLKAIDFAVPVGQDKARFLQHVTESFNLERDILEISKRLSHVVRIVDDGATQVVLDNGQVETVQYLVFELASESLRNMAVVSQRLPMSIAFSVLHNVAVGLRQLHGQQVAHQDLKPSNVLKFDDGPFKVCDLGRASLKGRTAPHDSLEIAGAKSYAPPELLYGQVDPDFVVRRWGCDAFLLGSLAAFLACGSSMGALIVDELDAAARPRAWNGKYEAVLPQVRAAFGRAIDRIAREIPDEAPYKAELVLCVRQLCDPDPAVRGHPITRAILANEGNVYDLERYLNIFDRLSLAARIYEKQKHKQDV